MDAKSTCNPKSLMEQSSLPVEGSIKIKKLQRNRAGAAEPVFTYSWHVQNIIFLSIIGVYFDECYCILCKCQHYSSGCLSSYDLHWIVTMDENFSLLIRVVICNVSEYKRICTWNYDQIGFAK